MKAFLLTLIFLALVPALRAEDVLFIGNSFIYFNRMPLMLEAIAGSKGKTASTGKLTKGGQGWSYHLYKITAKTDATLKSKPWNFVIIEDYSTNATHVNFRKDFFTNGAALYDKIAAEAPTAAIMLYETWSYPSATVEGGVGANDNQPDPADNPDKADKTDKAAAADNAANPGREPKPKPFNTEAEMFGEIHKNYGLLFEQLKAKDPTRKVMLAPVGTVFAACRKEHPGINLFYKDRKHPNVAGSYLIACVFYTVIFNDSPVGAAVAGKPPVDAALARTLQEVAAEAILRK